MTSAPDSIIQCASCDGPLVVGWAWERPEGDGVECCACAGCPGTVGAGKPCPGCFGPEGTRIPGSD